MSGMCLFKSMRHEQANAFIVKERTNRESEIEIIESLGNACKAYWHSRQQIKFTGFSGRIVITALHSFQCNHIPAFMKNTSGFYL